MAPGLPRRTVPILLRGLDQKEPKQTGIMGAVEVLQNMVLMKSAEGGYEFVPRPGTTNLSKTADVGSITSGMRLGTLGAGLVLLTGASCYRKATDEWHQVSATAPTVGVDQRAITLGSATVISSDSVYLNGYTVSAYITADNLNGQQEIRYSIVDVNGVAVVANALLGQTLTTQSYRRVKIQTAGTRFVISYFSTLSVIITALIGDTATPTVVPTNVTVANSAMEIYDAQTVGSSGKVAYVWRDSGTNQLKQVLLTLSSGTLSGVTTYAGLTSLDEIGYLTNTYAANTIYLAHVDITNGMRVSTFDGTSLALGSTTVFDAAVTSVYNIGGYRSGTTTTVHFTLAGANPWDRVIRVNTGGASSDVIRSLTLASRVVSFGGNLYALARWAGPIGTASNFLLDLTNNLTVGQATPLQAIDAPLAGFADQMPNLAPAAASNVLLTAAQKIVAVQSGGGSAVTDVGAVTVSFTMQDPTVGKSVELNGLLHIPGSQPYVYDGSALVEHGFVQTPTFFGMALAGGGGLTAGATYSYRITYEWTDAAGNVWRSDRSGIQTTTLSAAQTQVTLTLPTLRVTRKTNVSIGVYRTLANGDGSVFFKVSSATQPILNKTTIDAVTFVDQVSDQAAASGEPLYSPNDNAGSVLPNIAPPPCRVMAVHRGRLLIGAVAGDVDAVWFSKDVSPGFGVEFSDALVSRITSVEPITAVGSMDSYAVACTATQSWGSINEYPDDTGAGGVLVFQQQSDTNGCATIGLLGKNDLGFMTWGGKATSGAATTPAKGFWRSSRGLSWDYVGSGVEDDVLQFQFDPVAVVSVKGQNQMRFVGNGNILGRMVFVYETLYGTWANWYYSQAPAAFVDAVLWNGTMAYLCADGTVLTEDVTTYDDVSVRVPHVCTLSGLNLYGVAGFGRLYITQLTGRCVGGGNGFILRADQSFDGVAIATKSMVYGGSETELAFEVDPGTMGKSSRYDLSISDTANGANSAWTLTAVTALIGMKSGLSKLPPARRAT